MDTLPVELIAFIFEFCIGSPNLTATQTLRLHVFGPSYDCFKRWVTLQLTCSLFLAAAKLPSIECALLQIINKWTLGKVQICSLEQARSRTRFPIYYRKDYTFYCPEPDFKYVTDVGVTALQKMEKVTDNIVQILQLVKCCRTSFYLTTKANSAEEHTESKATLMCTIGAVNLSHERTVKLICDMDSALDTILVVHWADINCREKRN